MTQPQIAQPEPPVALGTILEAGLHAIAERPHADAVDRPQIIRQLCRSIRQVGIRAAGDDADAVETDLVRHAEQIETDVPAGIPTGQHHLGGKIVDIDDLGLQPRPVERTVIGFVRIKDLLRQFAEGDPQPTGGIRIPVP